MSYSQFATWEDLLLYLKKRSCLLYYKAPLDYNPSYIAVTKIYKNGKLRIASGPYKFTADSGHLDRFMVRTFEKEQV